MGTIDWRTQNEDFSESFSLNCLELNSTPESLSEEDSCFEIDLGPTPESGEKEFEFRRISFPSPSVAQIPADKLFDNGQILPLLDFTVSKIKSGSSGMESETRVFSGQRSELKPGTCSEDSSFRRLVSRKIHPRSESSASKRKVKAALLRVRGTSKIGEENRSVDQNLQLIGLPKNRVFIGSRKPSKISATRSESGTSGNNAKTSLIKQRSENLVSVSQELTRGNNSIEAKEIIKRYWQYMKPLFGWLSQRKNRPACSEKSGLTKLEVNAVAGVFEGRVNLSVGCKEMEMEMEMKSCPSSIKSSPLNRGIYSEVFSRKSCWVERDNSVHEAIVHCKESIGEVGAIRS